MKQLSRQPYFNEMRNLCLGGGSLTEVVVFVHGCIYGCEVCAGVHLGGNAAVDVGGWW